MAANSEVIKEFLISLGVKVDNGAFAKFNAGIGRATKGVTGLAAALTATAVAAEYSIRKVAEKFESLYYVTQRTKSSAQDVKAFEYAISQLGSTAEDARSMLINMGDFMHYQPNAKAFLKQLGVDIEAAGDSAEHVLIQLGAIFEKMEKNGQGYLAKQYAEFFGINIEQLQALIRNRGEVKKLEEDFRNFYRALGVDADKAAEDGKNLKNAYREMGAIVDAIGSKIFAHYFPKRGDFQHFINDTLINNLEKFSKTIDNTLKNLDRLVHWFDSGFSSIGKSKLWKWLDEQIPDFYKNLAEFHHNYISEPLKKLFNAVFPEANASEMPSGNGGSTAKPETTGTPQTLQDRIKQAFDFFVSKGLSAAQASGIIGNLIQESGLNPDAVGDHGEARGIAQWHGKRQRGMGDTLASQLQHVWDELQGSEQYAFKGLLGASTAAQAAQIFSKRYERPGNPSMPNRIMYAQQAMQQMGATVNLNQTNNITVSGENAEDAARRLPRSLNDVQTDLARQMKTVMY